MADWDFPNDPIMDQEYTFGVKTWRWNGRAWDLVPISDTLVQQAEDAAAEAKQYRDETEDMLPIISDTAPIDVLPGQTWINPSKGRKYIWVVDEDSSQWVEAEAALLAETTTEVDELRTELATSTGSSMIGHLGETVEDYIGPFSGVRISKDHVSNDHMLIRNITPNSATRMHLEPNGKVPQGTIVKYDMMFDPFDDDQINYRIFGIFNKQGKGAGFNGQNGITFIGTKAVGNQWPFAPAMHFGHSDDNANGVPLKIMLQDFSDTEWSTPQMGAIYSGKTIVAGEYHLCNFNKYLALTSGIQGATLPSHETGTEIVGGIQWQFVRRYYNSSSVKPVMVIGDRDDMPKFGLPLTTRLQLAKDIAFWNGTKAYYLNNVGTRIFEMGVDLNTNDFYMRSVTGGGSLRYNAASSFIQLINTSLLLNTKSITTTDTTSDASKTNLVVMAQPSATNFTRFLNLEPYKPFIVMAGTNNTTLVHGTYIKLKGGVNKNITVDEALMFISNSSGVAIQIG